MSEEEVGIVAEAVCRSLMGGREIHSDFLYGEATGGLVYLNAARAAIAALDKYRERKRKGPSWHEKTRPYYELSRPASPIQDDQEKGR